MWVICNKSKPVEVELHHGIYQSCQNIYELRRFGNSIMSLIIVIAMFYCFLVVRMNISLACGCCQISLRLYAFISLIT